MIIKNAACYSFSLNGEDPIAHLRLIAPLRKSGINIINGIENNQIIINRVSDAEIVIIQRDFPKKYDSYEKIIALTHKEGKKVVFDLDDLLFYLPENHPDRKSAVFGESLLPMFQTLLEADLVTVSTPKLKKELISYNENIVVFPNYFDDDLWHLTPPDMRESSDDLLTIGYMGGNSHKPDLEYITPVVQDLIKRYPQKIRFQFWGVQPPDEIASLPEVKWTPVKTYIYKDFSSFFQTQTADIFIAPLADNLFNRCKSPIKFFEYSALGVPGVFSRFETYMDIVIQGQNGLLASTLDEWTDCLIQLIENKELRNHLAKNAQETIRSNWQLSNNPTQLQEIYQKALVISSSKRKQEDQILKLIKSSNQQIEPAIQQMSNELEEKRQQVLTLKDRLSEMEQSTQTLRTELGGIYSSRGWRLLEYLRRIRLGLIPHGSQTERFARILMRYFRQIRLKLKSTIPDEKKVESGLKQTAQKGLISFVRDMLKNISRKKVQSLDSIGNQELNTNSIKFKDQFSENNFSRIKSLPVSEKVDIVICVGPSNNISSSLQSIQSHTKTGSFNLHLVLHEDDSVLIPESVKSSPYTHIYTHNMKLFNYAIANNLALRNCDGDVVLLNDDVEVSEGWLEKLQEDSKGVALTGAHTGYQRAGNPQMWGTGGPTISKYPINMFCAYLPKRLRTIVGLLDEEFCYYGGEDVDYSCRALLNGFPLMVSKAYVSHKDNQSYKESKELLIKESDKVIAERYGISAPFELSNIYPKVSIIMATRNRPKLLKSAIISILKIDYQNFELIIVDDGSNNKTSSIIKKFQERDDRVISVRLPKNVGSTKARDVGVRASKGQFILFSDDDDTVLSNRITSPLDFIIKNPGLDVVYCNYNIVDEGGILPVFCEPFDLNAYLNLKFNIGVGILFGRRQVFQNVPFMSLYDRAVDYDWVFRLVRQGYKIDLCPEIVMNYNRSGSPDSHLSGNEQSIKVHEKIHDREILLRSNERK